MTLRAGRAGRWTDRVEDAGAWVLLATGLLLIIFAGARGIGVHEQLVEQARTEASDRTPIPVSLHAPQFTLSPGMPMLVR